MVNSKLTAAFSTWLMHARMEKAMKEAREAAMRRSLAFMINKKLAMAYFHLKDATLTDTKAMSGFERAGRRIANIKVARAWSKLHYETDGLGRRKARAAQAVLEMEGWRQNQYLDAWLNHRDLIRQQELLEVSGGYRRRGTTEELLQELYDLKEANRRQAEDVEKLRTELDLARGGKSQLSHQDLLHQLQEAQHLIAVLQSERRQWAGSASPPRPPRSVTAQPRTQRINDKEWQTPERSQTKQKHALTVLEKQTILEQEQAQGGGKATNAAETWADEADVELTRSALQTRSEMMTSPKPVQRDRSPSPLSPGKTQMHEAIRRRQSSRPSSPSPVRPSTRPRPPTLSSERIEQPADVRDEFYGGYRPTNRDYRHAGKPKVLSRTPTTPAEKEAALRKEVADGGGVATSASHKWADKANIDLQRW